MKARAVAGRPGTLVSRAVDLMELTKPGITLMVVVTAGLGFLLAGAGSAPLPLLLNTLLGTGLLAAAGSALNHLLERDLDALMRRTAERPLPAGRLEPDAALGLGVLLAVAGTLELGLAVNLLTALLGALALVGYVFVYTPLKRVTSLATVLGAVPGALPPVMGWTAASGRLEPGAWVLFGLLFFWQLPHFLAIAWLCRSDYERAGLPMLTVRDPEGRSTGLQAVLWGAALLPVSLLPTLLGLTGTPYLLGALVLGLAFLGFCVAFLLATSTRAARHLLLASVLYLPAVLGIILLDRML